MSKCSVRSTLKSSFRYWTLFCPKYWAELCVGRTSSPPITRQHTTTAWKLCRTFMRLGVSKAVTFPARILTAPLGRSHVRIARREPGKPDSQEDTANRFDDELKRVTGLPRLDAQISAVDRDFSLRNPDGSSRQNATPLPA